jgi:LysM repeat protein
MPLLCAWMCLLALPAGAEKVKVLYTVKKGDSLTKIAGRFNVDTASIEQWNKALLGTGAEPQPAEAPSKKISEEDFPKVILPGTKLKIPKKDASGKAVIHEVQPGESFIQIARDYGVTKVKLLKWNKKLFGVVDEPPKKKKKPACAAKKGKAAKGTCAGGSGAAIHPGMELVIFAEKPDMGPRVGIYRASKGDSPVGIAKKFKVDVQDLLDYNFALKGDVYAKNDVVEIPMRIPDALSLSVGSPEAGKLVNGEKMPVGPGYKLKSPSFAYGTAETITNIVNCIGEVQRAFTGTHDLIIGHLSKKAGGKFPPHKSHRSGRDIDTGFYFKDVAPAGFVKADAANLDVERTMHFITCLADAREVEYIFIDYSIQEILYDYLKGKGTTAPVLASLLQFPRPVEKRLGLIRHEDGHDDHMHIRFVCPVTSKSCQD